MPEAKKPVVAELKRAAPAETVPPDVVPDTDAIRKQIETLLAKKDEEGRRIGSIQHGVYVFYDYFGEPIYVGRTKESVGTRTRRHLTNQRTDAVAMSVLDPMEVAEVEVWAFDLKGKSKEEIEQILSRAEYTVKKKVIAESKLKFVLNEKDIPSAKEIKLPKSYRHRIVRHRSTKPGSTQTSGSPNGQRQSPISQRSLSNVRSRKV